MKKILLFSFCILPLTFIFGQDTSEVKRTKLWRINFINPSAEFETPINSRSLIASSIGIGYGASYPDLSYTGNGWIYLIAPFAEIQYRNYYNLKKRVVENKRIDNNAGNFFAIRFIGRGPSLAKNFERTSNYDFALGPTWGMQRTFGKKLHFLFDIGPQLYFDDKGNAGIFPIMFQFNFGLNMNSNK